MSENSIKPINIISYFLNVVLALALVFVIRGSKDTADGYSQEEQYEVIKASIEQQERVQLPMTIQKLGDVNDIKIDSLVLTNNVEPYHGYMVTQWNYNTYSKKNIKKQVLVEVTDITCTQDKITWQSNWLGAKISVL